MKKLFFTIISLFAATTLGLADCPPASTSNSSVTLKRRVVGMLSGEFSVAANRKVSFSKGNLQYQAFTNTWRFAENQWDRVGNATGNNTSTGRDTQTGWIDLFGWGTSGNSESGTAYQPWATSTSYTDYVSYIATDVTDTEWTASKSDWGKVNEGQLGEGWRVLTGSEWNYLVETRKGANNITLWVKASVHGNYGLILLPDDWTQAKSAINVALNLGNSSSYSSVSDENWAALEKEGAVFLPAAGYREGMNVLQVNSYGGYWSSTTSYVTGGYVYFMVWQNSYPSKASIRRDRGCSVRLVQVLP